MGLPFEPKSVESMRARYPEAVKETFTMEMVLGGNRPGKHRKHVFDFEDGLRVIVSKEPLLDGNTALHFSFSFKDDSEFYEKLKGEQDTAKKCTEMIAEHVESMGGPAKTVKPLSIFVSEGGILHLAYEIPVANPNFN